MNLVLIIMLFILFFLTLQGWRKGILGIVYGLVSWIFIFVFVTIANPYVLDYLKTQTHLYDKVYQQAEQFVEKKAESLPQDTGLTEWYQSMMQGIPDNMMGDMTDAIQKMQDTTSENEQMNQILQSLKTQSDLTVDQFGGATGILQLSDGTRTLQQMLCHQIADFMMQGIATIVSLIIAQIIVLVVGFFVKGARRAPGIGHINGLLGLVAGVAEGFLVIWIIMYVAACVSTTTFGQGVILGVEQSTFLTYLYQHNLFMAFVSTM